MKRATVHYICNGYTVQMTGTNPGDPTPVIAYGLSIAEVVYWLASFFEPPPAAPPPAAPPTGTPTDRTLKSTDTLMNQAATVIVVDSGGYLVRMETSPYYPARPLLDEYCPNMDAVSAELTEIFTPPPAGSLLALSVSNPLLHFTPPPPA